MFVSYNTEMSTTFDAVRFVHIIYLQIQTNSISRQKNGIFGFPWTDFHKAVQPYFRKAVRRDIYYLHKHLGCSRREKVPSPPGS